MRKLLLGLFIFALLFSPVFAEEKAEVENTTIKLPAAKMSGGMPLMEALKNRHTHKKYSDKKGTNTPCELSFLFKTVKMTSLMAAL